ncbi:FKBP-type peptidyl-prolyl cis-trans isomerase [Pseudoalteromonas piscicida]|uniref:FKBP-type peptidyl-prolyl cis-trans isomerase n=1 Tax=Pseudoalteromonas piscicida TaxID=43662 RepID=UPI0027E3E646|nr:FKBP-type peptidyl-prolyl cis-trans isomerase [Pseudoalteromonas piscicida]WMO12768.1 FKBP-type peptidyl-prolyl cis-trans isomerase [Pseudoalteromonas piscicida]
MTTTNIILVIVALVIAVVFFRGGQKQKQLAQFNRVQAADFLKENEKRAEVHKTDSGLQYEIITQTDGGKQPNATSKVKVHYHGTLLDGSVFDSSVLRDQPISFGLNQVIPGWTEGVQLMSEGDKYRFWIGPDLGYGDRAAGKIEPGSLLVFEVELLAVE